MFEPARRWLYPSLLRAFHPRQVRIAPLSDPPCPLRKLLRVIVKQTWNPSRGQVKLAILQAFRTFLGRSDNTDSVVLMFSSAQGLSAETLDDLRLLSNSMPAPPALQISMVGQPELVCKVSPP